MAWRHCACPALTYITATKDRQARAKYHFTRILPGICWDFCCFCFVSLLGSMQGLDRGIAKTWCCLRSQVPSLPCHESDRSYLFIEVVDHIRLSFLFGWSDRIAYLPTSECPCLLISLRLTAGPPANEKIYWHCDEKKGFQCNKHTNHGYSPCRHVTKQTGEISFKRPMLPWYMATIFVF